MITKKTTQILSSVRLFVNHSPKILPQKSLFFIPHSLLRHVPVLSRKFLSTLLTLPFHDSPLPSQNQKT